MAKTKQIPRALEITAGALPRVTSQVLRDAMAGRRTEITLHGKTVAAVVSAEDLARLEDGD